MNILEGIEPTAVLAHFEKICSIPHGSRDTKRISDYLKGLAEGLGLRVIQDESNNLIIFKPGSEGRTEEEPLILQGHIDMVCEKEADCDIDFSTDGLRLKVEDGILSAEGTTLGGDDGIAVAYCMAILESDTISHPPLEVIFTVDEEIGMLGAQALDASPLKGKRLINLDSEEEGYLLAGCAGGATATITLPYETAPAAAAAVPAVIHISGLVGGHSGMEINRGRANANILMGRLLYLLHKETPISLVSIYGGLKDNAIPRDCTAEITLNNPSLKAKLITYVNSFNEIVKDEYYITDGSISVSVEFPADETNSSAANLTAGGKIAAGKKITRVMKDEDFNRVIKVLYLTPNGLQAMCQALPDQVETSLNLGILKTEAASVSFSYLVRSSVETRKTDLMHKLECLAEDVSASISFSGTYPAWQYRENSPLRETMTNVFEKMYGKKPIVESMHAGVECGLFESLIPGLDAISMGPDMKNVHTPQEELDLGSVNRTWEYILRVLEEI